MKRPTITRAGLSVVVTALLLGATPAGLAAQGAGAVGGDNAHPSEQTTFASSNGGAHITVFPPVVTMGHVLPGQDDVPAGEPLLREADTITVSAQVEGTGGGPQEDGGTCNPSPITVSTHVQLPGIAPHMDPPRPVEGGPGGVVTVPTWFWATFLGNAIQSSQDQGTYTTCTHHQDLLGHTVWSANTRTAIIKLTSVPTGEVLWNFGDDDVSSSCGNQGSPPSVMGDAHQGTIQHRYCVSSIRAHHDQLHGGYPVYVSASFVGHETLDAGDGGGDQPVADLHPFTDTMVRYPVREVQAVLDE